jgi:hypothetical protein
MIIEVLYGSSGVKFMIQRCAQDPERRCTFFGQTQTSRTSKEVLVIFIELKQTHLPHIPNFFIDVFETVGGCGLTEV